MDYLARQELVLDGETGSRIRQTRLLVVGAGAGGNEVLKNLALMGFGHFTIVDFDPIESSNLARAALFSKEHIGQSKSAVAAEVIGKLSLHEEPHVTSHNLRIQDLGKQVFLDHDIVISCVDTNDARAYLNDWCVRLRKPFMEMGFEKFVIQVCFFPNAAPADACLREVIGYGEFSGRRQSCSRLKMADTEFQHIPTIQVSSALAGAFVATEAILYLQGRSRLGNKILQYSADYHRCSVFDVPQSEKCLLHREGELALLDDAGLDSMATVSALLRRAKEMTGEECMLRLPDDFILSMECEGCGEEISIRRFKADVYDKERWCAACLEAGKYEEIAIGRHWRMVREMNLLNQKHAEFIGLRLADFAVKPKDLVRVDSLNDLRKGYLVKIH
jgi:molybdopterin/thiamine biosynthesis adenylyltransferase